MSPLFDVVDNVGGVDPAQKEGMAENVGVYTGFDSINPVLRKVVQPFTDNVKSA